MSTQDDSIGLRIYTGKVSHTRTEPKEHKLRYSIFQVWLDVEKPNLIDNISYFWSSKRTNLVRYKRTNYLPSKRTLYNQVCHTIKEQTSCDFNGKVYLLSNLSYWGYCYNPVSFYCCYDQQGKLNYILSEIHNTPWGERFTYVHDIQETCNDSSQLTNKNNDSVCFEFDKKFHVSPFMPMGLRYKWSFRIKPEKILISMNLLEQEKSIFNATLNLTGSNLTRSTANQIPFKYPLMCIKVISAIYWNAFMLWFKKVPFHNHPDS